MDCFNALDCASLIKSLKSDPDIPVSLNWSCMLLAQPSVLPLIRSLVPYYLSNPLSYVKSFINSLVSSIFTLVLPKIHPQLILNENQFKDIQDLKIFTFSVLQKYSVGQKVTEKDKQFLCQLFSFHPNAAAKLLGLKEISAGVHRNGEQETKCFIIEKENEKTEISYIKAIQGFLLYRTDLAETSGLIRQQEAVEMIIEVFVELLRDCPFLVTYARDQIESFSPHKVDETRIIEYYFKNLLKITEKIPVFSEFSTRFCIEKLLEVEDDRDKFDRLALVFFSFVQKNYCSVLFRQLLEVFQSHILRTSETLFTQNIYLTLFEKNQQNLELFISALIKSIYNNKLVQMSCAYLASVLIIYPSLTKICVKYLVYHCLKNYKIESRRASLKPVLTYTFLLIANKPELWSNKAITKSLSKILKTHDFLKGLPLQDGLDYSPLLSLINTKSDLCLTNVYLPFHTELPEFKHSCIYFLSFPLFFREKKRKRFYSTDVLASFQSKRRAYSIDESKFVDPADCESITTVSSSILVNM